MKHEDFRKLVETRGDCAVLAFVACEIAYSGRAETHLPSGDRILIIKADGTLLVHQPGGSMPVNYMKAGTEITFDGGVLHARNAREKAWLRISLSAVHDAIARRLADGERLDLAGNERDMSDWIRDNPGAIGLGFLPVSREEQTDVGFIDVFGHDGKGNLVVVECKRVTAGLSAVDQLRRYVERVRRLRGTDRVMGVLAAPGVTPNALAMLESRGFRFCRVDPPKRLERWQQGQARIGEF